MNKIRVLIASEDSSTRRGLVAIFASDNVFEVLGGFPLNEAREKAIACQPDAVLVDVAGDVSKFMGQIRQLKSECPCSLIIALVENEQVERLGEMLSQGVDSCVPRGMMRGCLLKSVELACRAGIFFLPASIKKMVAFTGEEKPGNCPVTTGRLLPGNGDALTRREMEILHLMAKNYSNREIASKLFISEPTVKTHVSSILRKLGQNNRAQAIIYSFKNGLVSYNTKEMVNKL